MKIHLYLVRHGNTFGPNDKVVWASSSTDFPLVPRGEEQARELAQFFKLQNIVFDRILCGPLQRTKRTAEILKDSLSCSEEIEIDCRLNEIDYGEWSGRTTEEIIELYGSGEVNAWNERSAWPQSGIWKTEEAEFVRDVHSLADEFSSRKEQTLLAVSSNGKLRYFLQLCSGAYEKHREEQTLKVKTGHVCLLSYEDGVWQEQFWDVKP